MKVTHILLLFLTINLIFGCNLGSNSSIAVTPASRPTVALQMEPTPTEIKPIESPPTATPVLDAPVIAYNEIKEGQLTAPGVADEWVFNAKAGERVNIVLNSQFDSYLELFSPDGEFIAGNDDNGNSLNAALFDLQLKQSGPHTLMIHGFDAATGEYALALAGGHPATGGGTLTDGASRTVMLSQQGTKWKYQGKGGTYLTINIRADDLVDSQLSLYGPEGTLLTSDDDGGGNLNPEIFEFPVEADGTYTIQAHTNANTGLVALNINSSARPSGGGPLEAGQTQIGILKRGRTHEWTFTGETGQIINLTMNSIDFDTFLELRDSQGAILAENDDVQGTNNSAINLFSLPANDTYTVIARGLTENDGGDYDITLKGIKVAPGGGPLETDTLTQALLVPGQTAPWVFEVKAGMFVTAEVQSGLLDTYLELYGPDGTLLSEDDDSGGDLNAALFDFPISESGEYQIVVTSAQADNSTGGVYDILLTLTENIESSGQLVSDQPQTSSLSQGEQHTWTFEASEDDFVTIKMESDTLDTYLALYDNLGELLDLNDDLLGTNAVIANFTIPESGEYRVIARSYSTEDEGGDYTIYFDITDQALPINAGSN